MRISEVEVSQEQLIFDQLKSTALYNFDTYYIWVKEQSDNFLLPAHKLLSFDEVYELVEQVTSVLPDIAKELGTESQAYKIGIELLHYLDPH